MKRQTILIAVLVAACSQDHGPTTEQSKGSHPAKAIHTGVYKTKGETYSLHYDNESCGVKAARAVNSTIGLIAEVVVTESTIKMVPLWNEPAVRHDRPIPVLQGSQATADFLVSKDSGAWKIVVFSEPPAGAMVLFLLRSERAHGKTCVDGAARSLL